MILGKIVVVCPKTGKEVVVHKDCVECSDFAHWGSQGSRPYVSCKQEKEESG